MKIAVLPGDGIGPEIVAQAVKVLKALHLSLDLESAPVGGAAYDVAGHPLPPATLELAKAADAILFGAVGDWKYDTLARELRPEQAILGLRKHLALFANFRPAICYKELTAASSLKPEIVGGLDILIVRELNGDIYFGTPKGIRQSPDGLFVGAREGFDTMRYSEPEIERIAHVAFNAARKRNRKVCSVDKSNVLETSQLWREVMTRIAKEYSDVELSHMYVDNAAMQLVRAPKSFDVIVTGNLFGDILSDLGPACTGTIAVAPSGSINPEGKFPSLFEPVHGSAPDIYGKMIANPIGQIWSGAMMLDHLGYPEAGKAIFSGIDKVLAAGPTHSPLTPDLGGTAKTDDLGKAIAAAI